ncbi:MAG TPA: thiamine pyrophosphate-dependent enzyme [Polyangia bacterium]|jgi:pyruvate dehydrogenase E1 component alpha subunit
MAGKELSKIRAGMGDVEAPAVEAWRDEDYARATGLTAILSPDGVAADRAAVPALAPAALRDCQRTMLRIRAVDERVRARAERAEDGGDPVPSARGCEAAIVGAVAALEPDDVVVPGRREAVAALWRGHTVAALAAGDPIPHALGVLPGSPHAATQLPHATGIAWAMKMEARAQGKAQEAIGGASKVALAFLDREGTSAEDFHAGLNFAGVFRVPAVFVCINGGPGPAAPSSLETVSQTLAIKALAYGFAGVRVDGGDLLAVFAAVREAAARARRGGGATMIEAVVSELREPELRAPAAAGDPLDRFGRWLASEKIVDAAAAGALAREVDAEVDAAFGKR